MPDRTTIAAMALEGLLANPNHGEISYDDLADMAVSHADSLIAALSGSAPSAPQAAPEGSAPTLRDLGVSGRAAAPLERMGVSTLAQLAVQSRADISEVRGVSRDALKMMDKLLSDNGLSWDWSPDSAPEPQPEESEEEAETVSETEDEDDLEDVL